MPLLVLFLLTSCSVMATHLAGFFRNFTSLPANVDVREANGKRAEMLQRSGLAKKRQCF